VIQGLCIYDVVAQDFYGHHVPEDRLDEIHLRGIESILHRILALDPQIGRARPFDQRLVSRCHHYALAWRACRRGEADPANFGIEVAGLRGLAFH
jgi:hypothetical protein